VVQVSASIPAELAWLIDLLTQTARYAEPALEELDRSLLPGVAALRPEIKARFEALWNDGIGGCPELLPAIDASSAVDVDAQATFAWFSTLPKHPAPRAELLSEPVSHRPRIRRRLRRLSSDVRVRRAYRNLLAEVWSLAGPVWERRGRTVVARSIEDWSRRVASVRGATGLLRLMPPRHPFAVAGRPAASALVRRRPRLTVAPIYFCMSGGQLADLGDHLLIGVPASAREPIRRTRDAAFVADRARVLAEPTRVHILIYLMSAPSGVMEITRALRMSQPTVSEHLRVLVAAGLVRRDRKGARRLYSSVPGKLERHLEDARGTLARWA
jgi:ArsR family transcriptional regulator